MSLNDLRIQHYWINLVALHVLEKKTITFLQTTSCLFDSKNFFKTEEVMFLLLGNGANNRKMRHNVHISKRSVKDKLSVKISLSMTEVPSLRSFQQLIFLYIFAYDRNGNDVVCR